MLQRQQGGQRTSNENEKFSVGKSSDFEKRGNTIILSLTTFLKICAFQRLFLIFLDLYTQTYQLF